MFVQYKFCIAKHTPVCFECFLHMAKSGAGVKNVAAAGETSGTARRAGRGLAKNGSSSSGKETTEWMKAEQLGAVVCIRQQQFCLTWELLE